jgi:hypothetical protein
VKPLVDKLLSLLRKGAEKIGIVKNIKSINELEDIAVNDEFYELIDNGRHYIVATTPIGTMSHITR